MPDEIYLLVCENFKKEVDSIIQAGDFPGVKTAAYPARCGNPPLQLSELQQIIALSPDIAQVHVLGCLCTGALKEPAGQAGFFQIHKLDQCFYMLAPKTMVDYYLSRQAYLLSPGWLSDWPERIAALGFDRSLACRFFAEQTASLVLLDTGVDPLSPQRLQEFAAFVERPFQEVPIGLDYCRLFLRDILAQRQPEKPGNRIEQEMDIANKKTGDYAMAVDFLSRLAKGASENEVIRDILEFFNMLFAPGELLYLPVTNGVPGAAVSFNHGEYDETDLKAQLRDFPAEYKWNESGSGFYIRLSYLQETYGIIKIGRFTFPKYKEHYLNLALASVSICGLAIENVRKYQKIVDQNDRLEITMAELERAKAGAEAANIAKSNFLAGMSHEIRTPLSAVIGLAHLLLHSELSVKQRQYIATLQNSANFLLALINGILDFSRIEAGKIELEDVDFNLENLLNETMDALAIIAHDKELELGSRLGTGVPIFLIGDPYRLRQVISNLLGNAIKFTEQGGVFLDVSLGKEDDREVALLFEVRDTGIGIPGNQLDVIFERFTQADPTISRKYGGSGLGLTISKKLVELMGGEISVTSRLDKGTTFRFSAVFRKQPAGSEIDAPRRKSDDRYFLSPLERENAHILLVEDNPINREILLEKFRSGGFKHIETAENGKQAVDLALDHSPDLVLMDVQMPVMDGNEATRELRQKGFKKPIVVLSASVSRDRIDESIQAGAVGYITKPVDFDNFFSHISRYLMMETAPGPGPGQETVGTGEITEPLTAYRIKDSCGKKIKDIFIVDAAKKSQMLNEITDEAALEKRKKEVQFAAHGYKGNASYLGLLPLQETAAELDDAFKNNAAAGELLPLVIKIAGILKIILQENRDGSAN